MRSSYLPLGLAALLIQPSFAAAQTHVHIPIPTTASPSFIAEVFPTKSAASLTLAAAIHKALQANPDLRLTARDIEIAAGGVLQAGARPNPELALLSEGLQKESRTTTVQLNQTLELGGKRSARIAVAERERDAATADLAARRAEVRANVVGAFFDVLAAQQRLQLAQAMQQLARQATDAAVRRVTAGKISPVEETRARVAEAGAKIELGQAAGELALARRRLAAGWGSSDPDFGELAAPDNDPAVAATLPALLARLAMAPQLVRARLEIARQQAQVEVERSRRIPDLTLSLGNKRDEQAGRSQVIVGLSLPIPVFDANRGNLLSALRKADKARDELTATEKRLELELAAAYQRHEQAKAELGALRANILPDAQSVFDAAVKGFELGKFNFLDVLDAQRTLFQSKAHYLRAFAESHRAMADMDRIVGADQQN
ncbi:TolC family protein [Undibacterium sp.]|uniref:TolC family protein n=1 Tax=Undibacterium sp. TaxID=1914977 RepID=UPI002C0E696F|nr:TolC family protein [Undibacterium sp.]HTD03965.1 TolC family protein [Undibacterium sp.]